MNRRSFLIASTSGIAGFRFARSGSAASSLPSERRLRPAKSTILFFLCSGASHIDTWDMKPDAPSAYRGPFDPIKTTAPGMFLCEHLPLTAKQGRHIAVIQGVSDGGRATGDHHAGYYYNLTGHAPDMTFRTQGNDRRPYRDDWPFMGSVVGSRRPQHPSLPNVITFRTNQAVRLTHGRANSPPALAWSTIRSISWVIPNTQRFFTPRPFRCKVGLRRGESTSESQFLPQ